MKPVLTLLVLSLFSLPAHGKERALLSCTSEGDGWKSELSIPENGKAVVRVRKGNGPVSECELKIRKFEIEPEAIQPRIELEFDRSACVPQLSSALEKELRPLSDISVSLISPRPKEALIGRFHWLTYSQSDRCALKTYDRAGLKLAHDRWERKLWPN